MMDWVWPLYEQYVVKRLRREGFTEPTDAQLESAFIKTLRESRVTVLVQEPWRGSVRFKCLARYDASDMFDLLKAPEAYLLRQFGGGKFKLNFHDGWNFVATRNFKPDGPHRWREMPELILEETT